MVVGDLKLALSLMVVGQAKSDPEEQRVVGEAYSKPDGRRKYLEQAR